MIQMPSEKSKFFETFRSLMTFAARVIISSNLAANWSKTAVSGRVQVAAAMKLIL
jgi:hypothetical protein